MVERENARLLFHQKDLELKRSYETGKLFARNWITILENEFLSKVPVPERGNLSVGERARSSSVLLGAEDAPPSGPASAATSGGPSKSKKAREKEKARIRRQIEEEEKRRKQEGNEGLGAEASAEIQAGAVPEILRSRKRPRPEPEVSTGDVVLFGTEK